MGPFPFVKLDCVDSRDGRYYRNNIDTIDTSMVSNSIGIEYLKMH